jgi:hypothetical protein
MSAVAQPRPRGVAPGGRAPEPRRLRARRVAASPLVWVLLSIGVAVLSWATLPTIPSYDPFSWIIWGREVSDPHLAFTISGGPSWKPLPFLFTVVDGLFGAAAPTLWVITARVGGLLGLIAAGRLAARLAGGARAGALAGLIAIGGILTTQDWGYYFLRGASEPGLIACTLWSIDRLLAGRRGSAFALALAAALIRPEWWPFLLADAVWLGGADPRWRSPARRAGLLAALALVPVLWFVPPWIGSGDPLLAATHAAEFNGQLGADPVRAIIGRAVDDQVWPLLLAAALYVAVAGARGADRRLIALGSGVLAWWLEVIAMTLLGGFPGLERFYLPAAAVVCALGAAGMVTCARSAGARVGGGGRRIVAAAVLAAVLAASAFASRTPVSLLGASPGQAALAQRTLHGMERAVLAAGGPGRILPCPSSFAAVNHAAQPALAWDLGVGLERVGTAMREAGVDFIGPANVATGIPAPIDPRLLRSRRVAHVGAWYVLRLTDPHDPHGAPCAGH